MWIPACAGMTGRKSGGQERGKGQQLVNGVGNGRTLDRRILQPFVIHDEAFDKIFGQMGGGPLAELGAARGAHPVAHRQDHVQVVQRGLALDPAAALVLNCQGFLDSCRFRQLPFLEDVLDVQADVLLGGLEQLRHLNLIQPDRAVLGVQLDFRLSVLGTVNNQFSPLRCAHAVTSRSRSRISPSSTLISASISASSRGGS